MAMPRRGEDEPPDAVEYSLSTFPYTRNFDAVNNQSGGTESKKKLIREDELNSKETSCEIFKNAGIGSSYYNSTLQNISLTTKNSVKRLQSVQQIALQVFGEQRHPATFKELLTAAESDPMAEFF